MFNLGFQELIVIGLVALIVLGPRNLPDAAKKLGKSFFALKRQVREIMNKLQRSLDLDE